MVTSDFIRTHRHSSRHLVEILAGEQCGCFYCCSIFGPQEIEAPTDESWEGIRQTALCPYCDIDSVIGSESGYPITQEFLAQMKFHWF